jgi:hypothetical protein
MSSSKKSGSARKTSKNESGPVLKYHFRSFGKPNFETQATAKETETLIKEEKIAESQEKGLDVYAQSTNFVMARAKNVGSVVRKSIAQLIGFPANGPWEVTSYEPEEGLYMVNYRDDADLALYGTLRGVCVDIINRAKVASLTRNIPVLVADQLVGDDGRFFTVFDQKTQTNLDFDSHEVHITRGFEGPQVATMYHNGNFYILSRKQIQSGRSRWPGCKVTIEQAYYACAGPKKEQLFDTSKKFSPWVHRFRVVYSQFLVASRQEMGVGYLVYEGSDKLWETTKGKCPYPIEQVDAELHEPVSIDEFPDPIIEPFVYRDLPVTLEDANNFLRYGWLSEYEDWNEPRLRSGESIIIHAGTSILQVRSPALAWRISIVGDTPNHFLRFCQLSQDAIDEIDVIDSEESIAQETDTVIKEARQAQHNSRVAASERFFSKYADLPPVDLEKLFDLMGPGFHEPLFYWPIGDARAPTDDNTDRLLLIWCNLLIAMPVVHQDAGLKVFQQFLARRQDLGYFIDQQRPTTDQEQATFDANFGPYFQNVLKRANQTVSDEAARGSREDSSFIFRQAVQKILRETEGDKLFRMMQNMTEYRQQCET